MLVCAIVSVCPLVFANEVAGVSYEDALRTVRHDEKRLADAFERACDAVVCIFADRKLAGGGSGVLIDSAGYGLTNYHVAGMLLPSRRGYGGLPDGRLYPLEVIGIDPGGDVALFRLIGDATGKGPPPFPAVALGDSALLRVGQRVAAMGNPFVLAEDFRPTVTLGIISGLHRYQEGRGNFLEYADCIQVSTSINPGNSGGPLFDEAGRLLGINGRAAFEQRGRVNVGLGFAVSINQIKRFLPGLRAGRRLEHGTLGATVREVGGRLLVNIVEPLSAAERAGVRVGDELLRVAGRSVRTANDFNNVIAIMPANWPVSIQLRRDGEKRTTTARLDRLPLPGMPVWVPDASVNRAEARRLLRRARRAWWPSDVDSHGGIVSASVTQLEPPADHPPQTVTISLAQTPQTRPVTATASRSANAIDSEFLREITTEWRLLTSPLLLPPKLDPSWEVLAGDEVAGRIVSVLRHRVDSREIRWKFDFDTGRLVEVTFEHDSAAGPIVWRPVAGCADTPETAWLRRETRGDRRTTWRLDVRVGSTGTGAAPTTSRAPPVTPAASSGSAHASSSAGSASGAPEAAGGPFAAAIEAARGCVVKLYGGALGGEHGYGSGVVVSADGHIVTALSLLLETPALRAVLPDGRRFPARVVRRDEERQLALLKVDATGLAFQTPAAGDLPRPGDRLVVAANPFKVSDGPEPVSVMAGVCAGRIRLQARRHRQEFPYHGPIMLTDVILATPGSAGGAVVDLDGRWVGLVGKAVISERTNTWINYAVPADQVAAFLQEASSRSRRLAAEPVETRPASGVRLVDLGLFLFDVGGRMPPAFVERVRPGGPADRAGIRPDDLILSIAGRKIASCADCTRVLGVLPPDEPMVMVLKRGDKIVTVTVQPGESRH